jgi:hypothetical protein
MSEAWVGFLGSVLGALFGGATSAIVMWWQTRSTIEASKSQFRALEITLSECSRAATEQKAALDFYDELQELKDMYDLMANPGRYGDGPREIAAVNEAQPSVVDFTGRFFHVFARGLATIPLPQREWLSALLDGITSHCWLKAGPSEDPAHNIYKPSTITKLIESEFCWVEWGQQVVLMIANGSAEVPPEPAIAS